MVNINNFFSSFFITKKAKLVTHSFNFHIDDIFACATLMLLMEKRGIKYEIIRTRETDELKTLQKEARERKDSSYPVFVFDVGGQYDEENNLFDHHQKEWVGERKNGVQYSSFGLVWKKYGQEVCGLKKVADRLDQYIVMGIDANDTGFTISEPLYDFSLYGLPSLKKSFLPISGKKEDFDKAFLEMVEIAKRVLQNEIAWAHKKIDDEKRLEEIISQSEDKKVIWVEDDITTGKFFPKYPEILFLVKKKNDGTWIIMSTLESNKSKKSKHYLPKEWGGLEGEKLEKVSGIKGAKFCHRGLWIAAAKSREAAEKMIKESLKSSSA